MALSNSQHKKLLARQVKCDNVHLVHLSFLPVLPNLPLGPCDRGVFFAHRKRAQKGPQR